MARDGTKTRERILDAAQQLILEQGIAATSIDEVLGAAGASKGAFFHHFPTKVALARAIVERYATDDVAYLESFMARAEATSDDPAEQLIEFVRLFEDASNELVSNQPSCLYVSYIFDQQLFDDGTNVVIADVLLAYRARLAEKIEAAVELHPPSVPVDPAALADHITVTFEGAFVLTRALDDTSLMRAQLLLVRRNLALLFGLPTN